MSAQLRGQPRRLYKGIVGRIRTAALLILILCLAFALRVYDLNWDQGRNLHPDERYVAVLAGLIRPPADLGEYFDPGRSPLNPFNTDWGRSYVYGTLPLFAGRYLGAFFDAGCGADGAAIPRALGQLIFGAEAEGCVPGHFLSYTMLTLVGRFMSALADTLAVLVVFLLGRQLFGTRVGLLAAALSALTVLNIQQAHYFTVDASANLFVVLNLLFSTRLAMMRLDAPGAARHFLANAALAGLASGLAVACKISTWPTAALIIASIGVALWRSRTVSLGVGFGAVLLAGVFAFGAFRVAQPYAFIGASALEREQTLLLCQASNSPLSAVCRAAVNLPDLLRALIAPSGRWIQQLYLAQGFVNGTIDAPFGIQWADRMPLVFPLINLVFWGMGLALGISSVLGFFYAARQLWLGRRWWVYLPIVLWVGGYFLYQGAQWTKSIRYLLPIYPALCVLAAHLLISFWRRFPSLAGHRLARAGLRLAALAPMILVLSGTALWARAFLHIYDGEITRVQASRWVYENVPTAITLEWQSDGGTSQRQLPIQDLRLEGKDALTTLALRLNRAAEPPAEALRAPSFRLNYLQGSGEVEARLIEAATNQTVAQARQRLSPSQPALTFDKAQLQLDHDYFLELRLLSGGPLFARTSVVANEHWDDAVPQPLDGRNLYGEYYRGLSTSSDGQMQNYNDDTLDKLAQMLDWLDEADYLVLSSNRLYGSIPRLPWRYPMTTRYYRALMNGELGFELAADFHAFPRLGPFLFNSQEMPQPLVRSPNTQGTPMGIFVPYPTAEEAFSVYDHPRVLIFRKTPRYSRERAERILGAADFALFMRRSPLESVNTPGGLLLDDRTLADQQAGGTWRVLFPRDSLLNQSQPLAVLAWLALTKALGLAAFMWLFPVIRASGRPALADGGYAAAQALGWLIPSWLLWILASARLVPFTPTAIWGVVGAFIVTGLALGHLNRAAVVAFVRTRWRVLLVAEGLSLFAFGFFLLIRAGNPDLWHPYMGGEKPMDFAYFNSILKATWFPPQDPWFAGGYINYYYFGWVMVGTPVKALGIDPAVAYNLIIPSLFSLTALGAFGLGASFYAALRRSEPSARGTILAGLLATALAVFLGNGDEIRVLSPAWQRLGGVEQGVPPAIAFVNGFIRWVGGAPLPIYPNWPYWNPTRPAPEVWIAEFPLFTFLYADLHAHMMAMPLAYLTVAFALAFAAGVRNAAALCLGALAAGMLWPTNSWDYPPYLLLALAGIWLGALREVNRTHFWATLWRAVRHALLRSAIFFVLTRAVMIPYLAHYGSAYNAIDRWENERTQLDTFITIYALFMIPLA
ncbi:MAG: DUF2298 domain-containing protein, partial [Thermoflexales bacterium]|nr:DUF2298 domain-containing protein [Thermoflexales bacterium]